MNESKPVWQSKTVLSVVVMVAAAFLPKLGVDLPEEGIAAIVDQIVIVAAGVIAIYGRISATKSLGG